MPAPNPLSLNPRPPNPASQAPILVRDLGGAASETLPVRGGHEEGEQVSIRKRAALLARIDAFSAELSSHERVIFKGFDILMRRIDEIDGVANKLGM